MSKDKITSMPAGKEIDELVAEKILGESKPIYSHVHSNVLSVIWSNEKSWYCSPDYFTGDICEWIPKAFSTDIAAAQEVINVMAREPFTWRIESIHTTESNIKWKAWLCGNLPDGRIVEFRAEADTIPLAICRAALLKGGGV